MRDDATVTVTVRRGSEKVTQAWDWRAPSGLSPGLLVVAWLREQLMMTSYRDAWNAERSHRAGLPTPPVAERN